MSEPAVPSPAPAPVAAAPPPKPAPAAPKPPAKKPDEDRRGIVMFFLGSWFAFAWTTFTGALTLMTLGTVRFMIPNVLTEPPSRVKVGPPETFEEGKVVERFKDQNIWVIRSAGEIYALSTTCTHLGCTPNWQEGAQKFKCPCHGSGFYISGINFEGPAPRPLERWAVNVGDDGQIVVDKSRKFQQERGEWSNPESFIKV
ncbi:MAG: ubiquinol-cytochrome c reductase iron-sulfur subunit [Gemmataceae bacterium]